MKLKNKVVIITGGSSGIGKAIAKLFAQEGAIVVITAMNKKKLQNAANEIGKVFQLSADIRKEKDVKRVVKKTISKFGRIDILINNAGIFPKIKLLHKTTESEWKNVIDVNLNGQFRFTKTVIPNMIKNNYGSIVNISSITGLKALENFCSDSYTASKGAMVLLTKALAIEYAKNNIRVNCVCPGVINTDMTKLVLSNKKSKQRIIERHQLGRIGTSEDIAKAALYFASDDSSWTTGSILAVDGGITSK